MEWCAAIGGVGAAQVSEHPLLVPVPGPGWDLCSLETIRFRSELEQTSKTGALRAIGSHWQNEAFTCQDMLFCFMFSDRSFWDVFLHKSLTGTNLMKQSKRSSWLSCNGLKRLWHLPTNWRTFALSLLGLEACQVAHAQSLAEHWRIW